MIAFDTTGSAYNTAMQCQQTGRFAEAEAQWRQLIRQVGEDPELLYHLGECCFSQKKLPEAERTLRRSLRLKPHPATFCVLGCVLDAARRNAEALTVLHQARDIAPKDPQVWFCIGNVLSNRNALPEALEAFRTTIRLNPNQPSAYFNAGNMLAMMHRPEDAEGFYRKVLEQKPDHLAARLNLGNVLMIQDRPKDAIPVFETLTEKNPQFPGAMFNLGRALARADRHQEAILRYRKALEFTPDDARIWDKLGLSLHVTDQTQDAINAFTQALKYQPDMASARFGIGTCLQITGDFAGAHREIRKALAITPDKPFYWNAIAMTKKFREGDPDIAALEALAAKADSFQGDDRPRVFFILGKVYSDLQRTEDAFAAWKRGNDLVRARLNYDVDVDIRAMHNVAETFSADFLAQRNGCGVTSDLPVFIVGMPRSGSSLVEQVLASHSDVFGAGELEDFSRIYCESIGNGATSFNRDLLSEKTIHDLGQAYLTHLRAHAPQAKRIVDKMPGNFAYAGLIRLALPGAKIIHVHRDARDCCLSCYTKQFISGQPFSYDLSDLGRYSRACETLMAYWRNVLPPENYLDIAYEDLVQDFEPVARRILHFCGLQWQDSCREFYNTKRIVRTASQAQVHQPLYTGSIGRWRLYEKDLAPLLRALDL